MDSLVPAVTKYRDTLSSVWSDSTANPRSRPLPEGTPPSFGQCEVASALLFQLLQADFPDTYWRLAYGRVLAVTEVMGRAVLASVIPEHFWIDCAPSRSRILNATVVDVTGDQANSPLLGAVVVGTYDGLNRQGVIYQPQEFYGDVRQFAESMVRYDNDFNSRFGQLQERFDQQKSPLV
jgi:hypothetical protein